MAAVPWRDLTPPKEGKKRSPFSFKKPPALEAFWGATRKLRKSKICTNSDFADDGQPDIWQKPIRTSTASWRICREKMAAIMLI